MRYMFKALTSDGKKVSGSVEASCKSEAIRAVEQLGNFPISVEACDRQRTVDCQAGEVGEGVSPVAVDGLPDSPVARQSSVSELSDGASRSDGVFAGADRDDAAQRFMGKDAWIGVAAIAGLILLRLLIGETQWGGRFGAVPLVVSLGIASVAIRLYRTFGKRAGSAARTVEKGAGRIWIDKPLTPRAILLGSLFQMVFATGLYAFLFLEIARYADGRVGPVFDGLNALLRSLAALAVYGCLSDVAAGVGMLFQKSRRAGSEADWSSLKGAFFELLRFVRGVGCALAFMLIGLLVVGFLCEAKGSPLKDYKSWMGGVSIMVVLAGVCCGRLASGKSPWGGKKALMGAMVGAVLGVAGFLGTVAIVIAATQFAAACGGFRHGSLEEAFKALFALNPVCSVLGAVCGWRWGMAGEFLLVNKGIFSELIRSVFGSGESGVRRLGRGFENLSVNNKLRCLRLVKELLRPVVLSVLVWVLSDVFKWALNEKVLLLAGELSLASYGAFVVSVLLVGSAKDWLARVGAIQRALLVLVAVAAVALADLAVLVWASDVAGEKGGHQAEALLTNMWCTCVLIGGAAWVKRALARLRA